MKRAVRIGLVTAALGIGLVVFCTAEAQAQVSFFGRFRGPHGHFSIGIGSSDYPVGSYVSNGVPVQFLPRYGYGFYCDGGAAWVPVRRYRTRWIVVEQPAVVIQRNCCDYDWGEEDFAYGRGYGYRRPYSRGGYVPYGGYRRHYYGRSNSEECAGHDD